MRHSECIQAWDRDFSNRSTKRCSQRSWTCVRFAAQFRFQFLSFMAGWKLAVGFRADLIVEDAVIVEIKSVLEVSPLHNKQLLTYLKLTDKRLGLLINFNVSLIKDGIHRVVNGLED